MTPKPGSLVRPTLICLAFLAATALALVAMGRPLICACGHVALWHGNPAGPETSQHLTDFYTFTHVIHGFLFYAGVWAMGRLSRRRIPFATGLAIALALECAWEVAENTPWIVDRYRAETIALGYEGDSIVNSLADIVAMVLGYLATATLPVAVVIVAAIATEVALAVLIRDNLALNVLMLLHPVESIKAWQGRR